MFVLFFVLFPLRLYYFVQVGSATKLLRYQGLYMSQTIVIKRCDNNKNGEDIMKSVNYAYNVNASSPVRMYVWCNETRLGMRAEFEFQPTFLHSLTYKKYF